MWARTRFYGDIDNMIVAQRAIKWLMARPDKKDAIISYGEGKDEIVMYVKRSKASISVIQQTK